MYEFEWLDPYEGKKLHTKPSSPFVFIWQDLGATHSVGTVPLWFKIINPSFITSTYIVKNICAVFRVHVQIFFFFFFLAIGTLILFCSPVNKWGMNPAFVLFYLFIYFLFFWVLGVSSKFLRQCFHSGQLPNGKLGLFFSSILQIFSMLSFDVVVAGQPLRSASSSCCCLVPKLATSLQIRSPVRHLTLPINVAHLTVNINRPRAE